MIDHAPDSFTRYDAASATISRLDRIYSCLPSWVIPSITIRAYVQMTATALHLNNTSDHAPATILFAERANIIASELPICPNILRSVEFRTFFDIFYNDVFDYSLDPPQQLLLLNMIIRTAAMKARQAIQGHKDVRGLARPELFFTLARVVWSNDLPLAETLILCSKLAAKHLVIDKGIVSISQPNELEEQYIAARAFVTRKKIEFTFLS